MERELRCRCGTSIRLPPGDFRGVLICPACRAELSTGDLEADAARDVPDAPDTPNAPDAREPSEAAPLAGTAAAPSEPSVPSETDNAPPVRIDVEPWGETAGTAAPVPAPAAPPVGPADAPPMTPVTRAAPDLGADTQPIDYTSEEGRQLLSEDPRVGRSLGHFRITRLLGAGGMGRVYEARDESLDRVVALKVLAEDLADDDEFNERFLFEARSAASINHPNITHIYFIGEQGRERFFAMEYVRGRDLDRVFTEEGPLDWQRGLSYLRQAAGGLRAAQERGIIHRDIKPSNLMLTPEGVVKITDFGLSKAVDRGVSITRSGATMGTPLYMAPEQGIGKDVDHRADMYSLGATFYHLLTGRPPFEGANAIEVMLAHQQTPPRSPILVNPDLPRDAAAIIERLLAKNPEERYATYEELIADVDRAMPHPVYPAGFLPRFVAAMIDFTVISGVTLALFFMCLLLWVAVTGQDPDTMPGDALGRFMARLWGTLLAPTAFLYEFLLLSWAGQTLGKRLMRVAVRGLHSRRMTRGQAALRAGIKLGVVLWIVGLFVGSGALEDVVQLVQGGLILFTLLSAAYIPINRKKRAFHDLFARTTAVYAVGED